MGCWPSHPDAVIAPVNKERSAIQIDTGFAASQPAPCSGYNRGARGCARGLGEACAALPDPHANMIRADQARPLDIGALRLERMMLINGA